MLEITENARVYWQNLLDRKPGAKYIRLSIKGGGCAGFSYDWAYTDNDDRGTLVDDLLVVDDIADTGETLKDFQNKHNVICTFHYHEQSIVKPDFYCEEKGDKWIVYPWETEDSDEIQDYLKEENVNE